uniref:SET domain containing 4 n=1 Tax=Amphilophus citrinellus TaxID=61819 RepID=A0A3Q0SIE8_AMPCI
VNLLKFLHQRGFCSALLQPALFSGLNFLPVSVFVHQPGQLVISLPESCLLTTSTVLDSYLGRYIKSWKPRLSPLLALCVFLVCEQHRGEASDWFPYIDVLPTAYTCPACFSDDVMALLPTMQSKPGLYSRVYHVSSSRWAWCSVNTRSVFMSHPSNNFLSGPDNYALAPFLDLLNHRPDVQVKAGFNDVTRCYEIRSVSGTLRYQQAFINYGSHDNQRLLLEYGFVAPANPHSVVYVDTAVLILDTAICKDVFCAPPASNLTVSSEGPSWRLMTALRLLSLPQTHQWKAVLLGQLVCEEREQWSVWTAKTLCQRLLQDTCRALDKVHAHKLNSSKSLINCLQFSLISTWWQQVLEQKYSCRLILPLIMLLIKQGRKQVSGKEMEKKISPTKGS